MNRKEVEDIVKRTLGHVKEWVLDEDLTIWIGQPSLYSEAYDSEVNVTIEGEEHYIDAEVIFDQMMSRLEDEKIVSPKEKK